MQRTNTLFILLRNLMQRANALFILLRTLCSESLELGSFITYVLLRHLMQLESLELG